MKNSWKSNIAKATGSNNELNKKALQIKKSWDEVSGILESAGKHTKKKKK